MNKDLISVQTHAAHRKATQSPFKYSCKFNIIMVLISSHNQRLSMGFSINAGTTGNFIIMHIIV